MNRTVRFAVRASLLAAASAAICLPLYAAESDELDEVVVTGSSIKGVAPVGSNLVTVGRQEIEETGVQTVQQILKTVPSIVGLQSAGQGSYGSFDGAGTNAPTIHGLGASASNSTLILLNGHRLPVSGINHVLADPNIVAPLALERVEVLADGASSVYGSDAVAGVVNFITRRNVDGFEATAQKGFGDNYGTFNAGAIGGKTWDSRLVPDVLQLLRSRQPGRGGSRLREGQPDGARRPQFPAHGQSLLAGQHRPQCRAVQRAVCSGNGGHGRPDAVYRLHLDEHGCRRRLRSFEVLGSAPFREAAQLLRLAAAGSGRQGHADHGSDLLEPQEPPARARAAPPAARSTAPAPRCPPAAR